MGADEQTFRRIVVDESGIRKKRGWFSRDSFDLTWESITGWAPADVLLASPSTGRQQVIDQWLELHHGAGVAVIRKSDVGRRFSQLVRLVQERLPGKQVPSRLEEMNRSREQQRTPRHT